MADNNGPYTCGVDPDTGELLIGDERNREIFLRCPAKVQSAIRSLLAAANSHLTAEKSQDNWQKQLRDAQDDCDGILVLSPDRILTTDGDVDVWRVIRLDASKSNTAETYVSMACEIKDAVSLAYERIMGDADSLHRETTDIHSD
jgi:hypothetical protein